MFSMSERDELDKTNDSVPVISPFRSRRGNWEVVKIIPTTALDDGGQLFV